MKMSFNTKNSLNYLLLILTISHVILKTRACVFTQHYDVQIVNQLPTSLKMHCVHSDEEDYGMSSLPREEVFRRTFCMNFWGTTKIKCHFWWGSKQMSFNVFTKKLADDISKNFETDDETKLCIWLVNEDGFYAPGGASPYKRYIW
ncbi:hypothetical protein ACP275_08G248800 [Erythranthe tilingii]